MDKFLRQKDSSSRTDDEEPSTSATKNLKKVVKRKYDEDYIKYGFSWCGDETAPRPQCIICGDQLSNESMVPKIRCLESRGNVLARLFELRHEVREFLLTQNMLIICHWIAKLAYMADIFEHLNELNKKMQGRNENILTCFDKLQGFIKKLELWQKELQKVCLEMYQRTKQIINCGSGPTTFKYASAEI
ncbi:SCAN domain-containing protein 3 [Trichonephila clavata]|uniref:SCAN domain-containing protein 3 n=1 Tax=Trichonephila clavata TaxID=2740835 RepID=A0A8X6FNC5_TRICU|nr:SCAN domain-containing protein 3 [Trichonephila clavata]